MAPIAVAAPSSPAAAILATKAGLLAGSSTPYSATSTAVSESGDRKTGSSTPSTTFLLPGDIGYIEQLVVDQQPTPATTAGTTVFGSATDILETLAVQNSSAVWVYDDAREVGFGARLTAWDASDAEGVVGKVHLVQTREGAGLELAGYAKKAADKGKISVFASTATLPYLVSSLAAIEGDVVIHVAATQANVETLALEDSLSSAGVLKSLTALPEEWDVIFSNGGANVVATGAYLYGSSGKVIHIVESTYSAREITSYVFPSAGSFEEITASSPAADHVYLTVAGHAATGIAGPKVVLNTLTPSPEKLFAALSGDHKRTVTVVGPTRADAEALKAVVLALLFSSPSSSTTVFPSIESAVTPVSAPAASEAKVVSFFTAPEDPFPQLTSNLFFSSPKLKASLAQFGSTSVKGTKSVLALSTGVAPQLNVETESDVIWVNDASVLKHTDVLATAKEGASLVLELPWEEADISTKLSAAEIDVIQKKNIRVFLLDLDGEEGNEARRLPIKEQAAFLLLYTGAQKLPLSVWKVLDAFHGGNLGRGEIEEAQAGFIEIPANVVKAWQVDEEKVGKVKDTWTFDALAGEPVTIQGEPKAALSGWEVAARNVLFREAFAVEGAKTVEDKTVVGESGIAALHPELSEETFLVTVSENRRLTPVTYDRNVFHLELDTAGTGLKYDIGEAIGIHGFNDADEVLEFCQWYGLDPEAIVSVPNPTTPGTVVSRTVFQVLQQQVDLFGKPGKSFYADLSAHATDVKEAMKLKFISAPEGAELFVRYSEDETVNFVDLLKEFASAHPTIEELIELVPEIKPRHYSIASSQAAVGDKVELLIVTVDWVDTKGRQRFGQCTRYLADLQPGAQVTVSIKPSVMKLPPDNLQPIIMAGLGTGAAPFRAFMQHRAWQRSQGIEVGPLIYYFGSRYRSKEYLYGEDIEAYLAAGIISHAGLAFSRDGPNKVYIQHKMKQDKKLLADALRGEGAHAAYFYLCGPTWPVPDVYEALVESLVEESDFDRATAEKYIEDLKEDERYVLEVY